MYKMDLWRQHREDLFREAEGERLVRRLRAAHPKRAASFLDTLLGRGRGFREAAGRLRAGDSRCARGAGYARDSRDLAGVERVQTANRSAAELVSQAHRVQE